MTEKTIEDKLAEVQHGDFVRVFYSKQRNHIKIKAGYAEPVDIRGLFVSTEFGYNTYNTRLRPKGERRKEGYIKKEQILKLEVLETREEILRELELLVGKEQE